MCLTQTKNIIRHVQCAEYLLCLRTFPNYITSRDFSAAAEVIMFHAASKPHRSNAVTVTANCWFTDRRRHRRKPRRRRESDEAEDAGADGVNIRATDDADPEGIASCDSCRSGSGDDAWLMTDARSLMQRGQHPRPPTVSTDRRDED